MAKLLREAGFSKAWVLKTTDESEDLFFIPGGEADLAIATLPALKTALPGRKVWLEPFVSGYSTARPY